MRQGAEFPDFWGNTVVHERNSDPWEFGKGALSELRFCGVAVLQSERGKRLEVGGRRRNIKCQMTNEKCQMSKLKCQMTNN